MSVPTQEFRELKMETALGDEVLLIEEISGSEALGRPFEFRVSAVAERDSFDFNDLIGTNVKAKLLLRTKGAAENRFFNGYVSQLNHVGYQSHGLSQYRFTLVPWLWFLTQSSNCRIFQQQTVPEILSAVFREYGEAEFDLRLNGNYPARDYCVQYRESDFNFVQRLMEHEGIYYFWEHTESGHRMIICDAMSTHAPVDGFESLRYRSDGGINDRDCLTSWEVGQVVTPGAFQVNSFNFESPNPTPNRKLLSRDEQHGEHAHGCHSVYDNASDYFELSEGERLAVIRREEAQVDRRTIVARTNARGLTCGSILTPLEVPRSDQSGNPFLVVANAFRATSGNFSTGDSGEGPMYEATISAIPSNDCVFRSKRLARIPRMPGIQTAMVTGPDGEEIFTDEFGRIKVQFHWDLEGDYSDGTSCWLRVSQAWAGAGWGAMAIPRIGQEVIVDFIEGDPDRPIVTGRVYNGDHPVPYDLPAEKTKTTFKSNSTPDGQQGHNEWRFEDKKGSEQIYIHAQKDMDVRVRNNLRETNYGHRHERIGWRTEEGSGGSHFVTVQVDENTHIIEKHYEMIDMDSHITVKGDLFENHEGEHRTHVGGDSVIKAAKHQVETSQAIEMKTGDLKLQGSYGVSVNGPTVSLEGTTLSMKSGGNFISVNPAGVFIKGNIVAINSGGSAMGAQQPGDTPVIQADEPFDASPAVESPGGGSHRYGGGPRTRGSGPASQHDAPDYDPPVDPGSGPVPPPAGQCCESPVVTRIEWVEQEVYCSEMAHIQGEITGCPDQSTFPVEVISILNGQTFETFETTIDSNTFTQDWKVLEVVPTQSPQDEEELKATGAGQESPDPLVVKFISNMTSERYAVDHARFNMECVDHQLQVSEAIEFTKGYAAAVIKLDATVPAGTGGLLDGQLTWPGYRWMKKLNGNLVYWNGTAWTPLPAAMADPPDSARFSVGFHKQGANYVCQHGGNFPENMPEWDHTTAARQQKLRDWENNIRTVWTGTFDLKRKECESTTSDCCRYPVSFSVGMSVHLTFSAGRILLVIGNDGDDFRSNDSLFFIDDNDLMMAGHEFGHHLGNPDEYAGANVDTSLNDDGAVAGIDPNSIMGQNLTTVKKRHFTTICNHMAAMVSNQHGRAFTYEAIPH